MVERVVLIILQRGYALSLFVLFIVSACTSPPTHRGGPGPLVRPQPTSPAVSTLLRTAEQEQQAGHLDDAGATLERALNIEPRNALVWHRLATLRLQQRRWDDAEQMALKSNALSGADSALQAHNWNIIARVRNATGDVTGARAAQTKAMELEHKGN